jgi:hypothetical protein
MQDDSVTVQFASLREGFENQKVEASLKIVAPMNAPLYLLVWQRVSLEAYGCQGGEDDRPPPPPPDAGCAKRRPPRRPAVAGPPAPSAHRPQRSLANRIARPRDRKRSSTRTPAIRVAPAAGDLRRV